MTLTQSTPLLAAAAALLLLGSSGGGLLASAEEVAPAAAAAEGSCPPFMWGGANPVPFEHTDAACNRLAENDLRRDLMIEKRLQASIRNGSARQLKDDQTWYCPADEQDFGESDEDGGGEPLGMTAAGPPSAWIVHNRATTPAVVSWVAPTSGGGNVRTLEVSAMNPKIFPAHHDPKAVLQPGQWAKVEVSMGLTYHVRELVTEGGGKPAPGRILLRHRPGPIPVKNRFGGQNLTCPVQAIVDPEPKVPEPSEPKKKPSDPEPKKPGDPKKRPNHDKKKPCNAIPSLFVNHVHCPVDVFYAGVDVHGYGGGTNGAVAPPPDATVDSNVPAVSDKGNEAVSWNRKKDCREIFSFHLGVNPAADASYLEKWDSPLVFVHTYLTHRLVARLRHDRSVVVDEIIIEKTIAQDCPKKKKTPLVAASVGDGVGATEDVQVRDGQTDAVASADGGETREIVLTDYPELAALFGGKNATVSSATTCAAQNATNATETVDSEGPRVAPPEGNSVCEANVLSTMSL